jgi:sugar lactone lactonase YvrE
MEITGMGKMLKKIKIWIAVFTCVSILLGCQVNGDRTPISSITKTTQEMYQTATHFSAATDLLPSPFPTHPVATAALTPGRPSNTPTPTATAAVPQNLGETVAVAPLPQPDDLYLAPDGMIYISDVTDNTVRRLGNDGKVSVVASGLSVPEGIVQLADGALIVAEQGKDRLVRLDPATGQISPFLALHNPPGGLGVDGIAIDNHIPGAPSIIVPDSPNGTLLRVSTDGRKVSVIASGFLRPTGAWVEPDGSVLVADENAGALVRLRPDGSRQVLSHEPLTDDVIEDPAENIFVISISQGTVHLLHKSSDTLLVKGLSSPQGLCFDPSGNLLVAESGKGEVVKVKLH